MQATLRSHFLGRTFKTSWAPQQQQQQQAPRTVTTMVGAPAGLRRALCKANMFNAACVLQFCAPPG